MWREEIEEISYQSSADATRQPAVFFAPATEAKVPLLVGLHTWSFDCFNPSSSAPWADWCIEHNWSFIYPNFRGPNCQPEAMGSELAVSDIIDAVKYARKQSNIDSERIYLLGGSGGGYAALLMAGRYPDIWAGVSAWCPIIDLKKWHQECHKAGLNYSRQIEQALGGSPEEPEYSRECRKRSAATYLHQARNLSVDINTGIHDGHNGSVPISHALEGFNILAAPEDRLTPDEIDYFVNAEAVPEHLKQELPPEPLFGNHRPLFRRTSSNIRVTIFEGGHDILAPPALNWLAAQQKSQPSQWDIDYKLTDQPETDNDTALGY